MSDFYLTRLHMCSTTEWDIKPDIEHMKRNHDHEKESWIMIIPKKKKNHALFFHITHP